MHRVTDFLFGLRVISESGENLSHANKCLEASFA